MSEEDKKMLIEMKLNCLEDRGTSRVTYNDEKRLKKAKAIDNALNEIERLNNIINELEKYLDEQVDYMTHHSIERMVAFDCCRHKLQELKGSDSNE